MLLKLGLLALSTSIDSIGIGISYGIRKIKISKMATIILGLISFITTSSAILLGKLFGNILPSAMTNWLGSFILIFMGMFLLFQVLKEPESYDLDNSKQIDSKEAIALGVALSLDSFSIGIAAGVMIQNAFWLFPILVVIFQILFLSIGSILGTTLKTISHIPSFFWNILASIILILIGIIML